MTAKKFLIKGSFRVRGITQTFSKEVTTLSRERAVDKVYSLLGSNHKVKRGQILIEDDAKEPAKKEEKPIPEKKKEEKKEEAKE